MAKSKKGYWKFIPYKSGSKSRKAKAKPTKKKAYTKKKIYVKKPKMAYEVRMNKKVYGTNKYAPDSAPFQHRNRKDALESANMYRTHPNVNKNVRVVKVKANIHRLM